MSAVRGDVAVARGFTTIRPRTQPTLPPVRGLYAGRVHLGPAPRSWGLRVAAPLVAAEGVALFTYGLYLLVSVIRFGITGPAEVSNVPAVVLEIAIFIGFGVALAITARGLWQARRPARAPAVLAQVIAVVVGGPLAFSTDSASRVIGIVVVVVAVTAAVASFGRGVTDEMMGTT